MSAPEGVCRRCGFTGPGVHGGIPSLAVQCPRCCSVLEYPKIDWVHIVTVVLASFIAGILALLVVTLLGGCGREFTADGDLFAASGATDAGTGAAGSAGAAGARPEPGSAGAAPSADGGAGAASQGGAPAVDMGGSDSGGAAPCAVAGWRATAFAFAAADVAGGTPSAALDGELGTRWASGEPQALGQWFELDLPAGVQLERLELETTAGDMPHGLELDVDGAPPSATPIESAPGVLAFELTQPTPARVVRLIITQPAPAPAWWSISELRAVCK